MNDDTIARNIRDFLGIYNVMSERCFAHCVEELGQRTLTPDEIVCVDRCVTKGIRGDYSFDRKIEKFGGSFRYQKACRSFVDLQLNHLIMDLFTKIQPEIRQKREKENEAMQQKIIEMQLQQQPQLQQQQETQQPLPPQT